jgi:hypothetical protein
MLPGNDDIATSVFRLLNLSQSWSPGTASPTISACPTAWTHLRQVIRESYRILPRHLPKSLHKDTASIRHGTSTMPGQRNAENRRYGRYCAMGSRSVPLRMGNLYFISSHRIGTSTAEPGASPSSVKVLDPPKIYGID